MFCLYGAEAVVTHIICRHGITEVVLSDQGSNFLSKCCKEVCKLLKIHWIQSSAFRPTTNGQLERSHKTLAEYLRNYIDKDQRAWCRWLPYAMFVYNTTPHTSTGVTPHELLYVFQAQIPSNLSSKPTIEYNYDNYAAELRARLRHSHEITREKLFQSKLKSKVYYDKNSKDKVFKVGDLVLLRNETRRNKFERIWKGSFK